jgi:signal transduction histidine kinase
VTLHLDTNENRVHIKVIDNGPGIPDSDKIRIFERFVRLDSSRTRRGNGLGLAMVRAVACAHGGSVTISDTPGGGATFTVTLPRR